MALIEDHQAVEDEEGQLVIEEWKEEVLAMLGENLATGFNVFVVFH